jgi:hypothetical protein
VDCGNINDYCSVDEDGNLVKLSLGEKEALFLDSLSVSKTIASSSDFTLR